MSVTCRYRYVCCEMNVFFEKQYSSALGLTGNRLEEDAWLLGFSRIYNVRKLTKNSVLIMDFLA